MSELTPKFNKGDKVEVKLSNGKWDKKPYYVSKSWYTTGEGRKYQMHDQGVVDSKNIRPAKK